MYVLGMCFYLSNLFIFQISELPISLREGLWVECNNMLYVPSRGLFFVDIKVTGRMAMKGEIFIQAEEKPEVGYR